MFKNNLDTYNILVIEDNIGDFDLIKEFLDKNIYFNFLLSNEDKLSSAFLKISKQNFDIILLDLNLTDSYGFDTFENLYKLTPTIPIIVLSGSTEYKLAFECVKRGAQDYLIKGDFNKSLLVRSIMYAIERKKTFIKIQTLNEDLENKVAERTKELNEINITLKNVLKNIQNENNNNLENIFLNIEKNIIPLIETLKKQAKANPLILKQLLENINSINSGFHKRLINFKYGLTPTEIKVCKLVKTGYLAKEIAEILFIATTTVNEHKSNIRKKLGLNKSTQNLKLYLDEISPD